MGKYEAILDKEQTARLFSVGEVEVTVQGTTWKDSHNIKIILGDGGRTNL